MSCKTLRLFAFLRRLIPSRQHFLLQVLQSASKPETYTCTCPESSKSCPEKGILFCPMCSTEGLPCIVSIPFFVLHFRTPFVFYSLFSNTFFCVLMQRFIFQISFCLCSTVCLRFRIVCSQFYFVIPYMFYSFFSIPFVFYRLVAIPSVFFNVWCQYRLC